MVLVGTHEIPPEDTLDFCQEPASDEIPERPVVSSAGAILTIGSEDPRHDLNVRVERVGGKRDGLLGSYSRAVERRT